jgi:hypothetical protein
MGALFLAPAEVPGTTGRAAAADVASLVVLHPVPEMAPDQEPWEPAASGDPGWPRGPHAAPVDLGWDEALLAPLDEDAEPPWQVLVAEAAEHDRAREAAAPETPVPWAEFLSVGEQWATARPDWTEAGWWEATLRDDVRALLWLPVGPALVAALASITPEADGGCALAHAADRMLSQPTPGHAPGWPCACQVVVAAAWQACSAWSEARLMAAVVAAAGPRPVEHAVGGDRGHVIVDPAREELATALRWSPAAMANRITTARAVVAHPPLLGLVAGGAMSGWAARLVIDQLVDLSERDASRVVAETVARVRARLASGRRGWTSAEVGRAARSARLKLCPQTVQEARVRAFSHRRVQVHTGPDGMATLVAQLADVDAHRIHRRLTAIAAGLQADAAADGAPEPRSRDQLRADVLVDLVLGGTGPTSAPADLASEGAGPASAPADLGSEGDHSNATPSPGPGLEPRPEIMVIVSLEVLLGLSEDPAEVPGLGPIAAGVARGLAADGTWRAWVADAAGVVTATGSRGYTPSAAVARAVRAREPHCRFPGCRQPAQRCDLDHAIPWPRGSTTAQNLGPLCRRHHQLKTHAAWALDPSPPPAPGHVGARQGRDAGGPAGGRVPVGAHDDHAWRWRTPAGIVIHDAPAPHLRH